MCASIVASIEVASDECIKKRRVVRRDDDVCP